MLALLASDLAAQPYLRQIDPFPVRDSAGVAYTHPFLGGLNVPRPQFLDIDGDDDLDLFVQERTGELIFFENTGSSTAHRFTWRTDAYADLDVGEWARFADLDNDGDFDVLAEQRFSYIRMYRNIGTPTDARFELAADSLKDIDGTPLFADRQNLLALADIDCDGLIDLFLATLDGYLTYYTNLGLDDAGFPSFQFVDDRYQNLEIIGGIGKRGRDVDLRHGANALAFADLDEDEDPDLLWGDFFSPSLYFIENTGSCETPTLELVTDLFPMANPLETSGFNIPTLADLDGDGDEDLFAGILGSAFGSEDNLSNFYFYRHTDTLTFSLETRQFISSLDVNEESMPIFADLDGDDDLDLLVGNNIDPNGRQRAQLFRFINEGTTQAPNFRLTGDVLAMLQPDRAFNIAPAVADLDADGDPDLLLGQFNGSFLFYRNDRTADMQTFVEVDLGDLFEDAAIDIGQNSTPVFVDLDSDGDADLIVGESGGTLNFFRNTGTPEQPHFVEETGRFANLDAGSRSVPTFHDVTGNGLLDLIVGTAEGEVQVYRNTGTAQEASFVLDGSLSVPGTVPANAAPAFADLDADGDTDLFLGGLGGGLFYYRNEAISTATEPASNVPSERIRLLSNAPNPFRDATMLRFVLAQAGRVRVVVYDALGRTVAMPVDEVRRSGEHEVVFEARHLPSGLYFYRLTYEDGAVETGSMLRIR